MYALGPALAVLTFFSCSGKFKVSARIAQIMPECWAIRDEHNMHEKVCFKHVSFPSELVVLVGQAMVATKQKRFQRQPKRMTGAEPKLSRHARFVVFASTILFLVDARHRGFFVCTGACAVSTLWHSPRKVVPYRAYIIMLLSPFFKCKTIGTPNQHYLCICVAPPDFIRWVLNLTPDLLSPPPVGLPSRAAAETAPTTSLRLAQRSLQEGGTNVVYETDNGTHLECVYFGEGSDTFGEVIFSEGEESEEVRAIVNAEGDVTSLKVGGNEVYADSKAVTETTSTGSGVSRRAEEANCDAEECQGALEKILDAVIGLFERTSFHWENPKLALTISAARDDAGPTCEKKCPPGEFSSPTPY